jgi:succinate dehydrogenase / fumarate reductase, membrane anchor subunit
MVVNRIVVGAHYGAGSWIAQRVTALLMALYTLLMLAVFFSRSGPMDYAAWKALFAQGWMRIATLIFAVSLAWHAWVGLRDILMDYARPDSLRFGLQVVSILLIAVYLGWTVQILWR